MAESKKIINRDISWLSFNARVLQEAEDKNVPLIERFKFLGIFSANMDEFFRVRVASIKRLESINATKVLGMSPKKLLSEIQHIVLKLTHRFDEAFLELEKELEKEDIYIINEKELNPSQSVFVRNYFRKTVRPNLVPIMLNTKFEFPNLKDKSIYLAIKMMTEKKLSDKKFALIELPTETIPRFLVLPEQDGKKYLIFLDDVIRHCLDEIFYIFDYTTIGAYTIKVTRDAELDLDDDLTEGVIQKISRSLKQRKKGRPVRFIYDETMPVELKNFITRKLGLFKTDNIIPGARYHNFKDLIRFPDLGKPNLLYEKIEPIYHPDLSVKQSIFKVLDKKDIWLQYPYHATIHMVDFFREAAIDPSVISIKTTIYRVAQNSAIGKALVNAVRNGKQVTVVVELQARFDEENNIYWANKLREEGAKVVFGFPNVKIHSKLSLITRKLGREFFQYAYISTGNFNEQTSNMYVDHALLSSDVRLTEEVSKVFGYLENIIRNPNFKHLLVSPFYMRNQFVKLIDKEIRSAKKKSDAWIIIKTNSLIDTEMVLKLYEASKAGVKIKLIIRGICGVIPGVKGMSENIQAISIVDRYLEHSRMFVFCNGGNEKIYFGSADWMTRNLDHRVEVICPVYDRKVKQEVMNYLNLQLSDNTKARILNPEQNNIYKRTPTGNQKIRAQIDYYQLLLENNSVISHK